MREVAASAKIHPVLPEVAVAFAASHSTSTGGSACTDVHLELRAEAWPIPSRRSAASSARRRPLERANRATTAPPSTDTRRRPPTLLTPSSRRRPHPWRPRRRASAEPREILEPELRERMEAPSVIGEEDIERKETVGPAGVEQIDERADRLVPLVPALLEDATEVRGRTSFEIAGEPRDRGRQFRPERG